MTRRKVSGIEWVYRDRTTGRYYVRVQAHESAQYEGGPTLWVDEFIGAGPELHEAVALRERIAGDIEREMFFIDAYKPQLTPTLSELVEDLATAKAGAGRRQKTVYDFRLYASKWESWLGDLPADAVHYKQVRSWWDAIKKTESPAVCNKSMMTLRATIEHARSIGARSEGNPTRALLRARVPVVRDRPTLNQPEFSKILDQLRTIDAASIDGPSSRRPYMGHASYFITMAALAARGAEVVNLQWDDIDRDAMTITLWDTKTAPSLVRPVAQSLLDELDAHLERMKAHSPPAMRESDYIFPAPSGERSSSGRPKRAWPIAVERAGYPVGRAAGGWTPHDVRRLGIYLLYEAGGQERDVMQYVGHNIASVHALYIQRNNERLRNIAEHATDALFGRSVPANSPPQTPEKQN